jgi:hypothetical protein
VRIVARSLNRILALDGAKRLFRRLIVVSWVWGSHDIFRAFSGTVTGKYVIMGRGSFSFSFFAFLSLSFSAGGESLPGRNFTRKREREKQNRGGSEVCFSLYLVGRGQRVVIDGNLVVAEGKKGTLKRIPSRGLA